ncbi:MAG: phenylalanine--tRNA ligase subunit beta [Candidatus Methanomethylicota archaeon]|uniref:phenylalanine--tRNA ligase n=1 Tax=Thermoproteota archaeon TaxID=2056631 RepID=A0A497EZX2_9CREN|nr:MAG: phenylalanine--tRNA ligase subunit beta [Candidatus Verstraetearchaeota archaeon]
MIPIKVNLMDLQTLVGAKLSAEDVSKFLTLTKCEIKFVRGELIELLVSLDRPDLFSAEGISRAIKHIMGIYEEPAIDVKAEPVCQVRVDDEVLDVRPYIACAVVENVNLSHEALMQMRQLQRKLHETYCGRKLLASIEIHDYSLVEGPLTYTARKIEEITLSPRGRKEKLKLTEVMMREPWRRERYLLHGYEKCPVIVDSAGEVLSAPPIVESAKTKITPHMSDVLLIVTGTNDRIVKEVLEIFVANTLERGGTPKRVKIQYPDDLWVTPLMESSEFLIEPHQVEEALGIKIDSTELIALLLKSGFKAKIEDGRVRVIVPPYRIDVIHEIDIIEDIGIIYGFENVREGAVSVLNTGKELIVNKLARKARKIMAFMGFQEVITHILSNREALSKRMRLETDGIIEIVNPILRKYSALRSWLLPKLLEFLSNNKHAAYPQKIFEIGKVVTICKENEETKTKCTLKLAAAMTDYKVGFEDIQASLFSLLENLQIPFKLEPAYHPSFIRGRTAQIRVYNDVVGILGEIYPEVLENFKLENPVAAFEIDLERVSGVHAES